MIFSTLCRSTEEESKPNALDDWANDPLLSSTRLPEIGIHDPDIHGNFHSAHHSPCFHLEFERSATLLL
jgi:hypothetical protein